MRSMADVIHKTIPYSGLEKFLLLSPVVMRLHRVSQSSLVFLTFPSNKVKRFEHSLGVMHLSGKMFSSAVSNTKSHRLSSLLKAVCDELVESLNVPAVRQSIAFDYGSEVFTLDSKLENVQKIKERSFDSSPFFHRAIPTNVPKQWHYLCAVLFQGIRIAGLLHDIGHFPYSHTVEEVLTTLLNDISHKDDENRSKREREFLQLAGSVGLSRIGAKAHESIGQALFPVVEREVCNFIKGLYGSKLEPLSDRIFRLYAFQVARKILSDAPQHDKWVIKDTFSPILSSMIDADRLDYVSRDLLGAAVSADIVPYDRIFLNFLFREVKDGKFAITTKVKAIGDIEEFLRKRWKIYRDINFHHSVHKSELFMRKVLLDMARSALTDSSSDTLVTTDGKEMSDFISGVAYVFKLLGNVGHNPEIVDCILKLDDAWLDTLLKRFHKDQNSEMLSALITGRERYISVFKRFEEFFEFDEQLFYTLFNDTLSPEVYNIAVAYLEYYESESADGNSDTLACLFTLVNFLSYVFNDELNGAEDYIVWRNNASERVAFCFHRLTDVLGYLHNDNLMSNFIGGIEEIFKDEIDSGAIMIGKIELKDGIDQGEFYVRRPGGKYESFVELSALRNHLKSERGLLPAFHLYCLKDSVDESDVKNRICKVICQMASKYIHDFLDNVKPII